MFHNLFHWLTADGSRRLTQQSRHRLPTACRLSIETLDDRIVPAALSVADTAVVEGNGVWQVAEVVVRLNAPSTKTVTVNYSTSNGTAKAPRDYTALSGKLTFARGETSKSIIVPIPSDSTSEGRETFFINLTSAKNAEIADSKGVVTIVDDRPSVRLELAQAYPGETLLGFVVTLSAPSALPVTVSYSTADVTALAGVDYVPTTGTLTFAPGETVKGFVVQLLGDTTVGSSQELRINLMATYADGLVVDSFGYGIIWNADGYGDGSGGGSDGGWW